MFALFFSLYVAMFTGSWNSYSLTGVTSMIDGITDKMLQLATSIFGNNQMSGVSLSSLEIIYALSLVLTCITSIGIVVMAVKGVKKAFGIFFMGIR